MPVTRTKLDVGDVQEELQRRGYGFHLQRGYALTLNVRSGEKRSNGDPVWRHLIPITRQKLDRILEYCETINEAANQVELLSHGKLTDPNLPAEHGQAPTALDSGALERIAAARADHAVAKLTAQHNAEMAQMREQIERLSAKAAAAPVQQKRGRGRPPGSKNRPKVELISEGPTS